VKGAARHGGAVDRPYTALREPRATARQPQKSEIRLQPAEPDELGAELVALLEDFVDDERAEEPLVPASDG